MSFHPRYTSVATDLSDDRVASFLSHFRGRSSRRRKRRQSHFIPVTLQWTQSYQIKVSPHSRHTSVATDLTMATHLSDHSVTSSPSHVNGHRFVNGHTSIRSLCRLIPVTRQWSQICQWPHIYQIIVHLIPVTRQWSQICQWPHIYQIIVHLIPVTRQWSQICQWPQIYQIIVPPHPHHTSMATDLSMATHLSDSDHCAASSLSYVGGHRYNYWIIVSPQPRHASVDTKLNRSHCHPLPVTFQRPEIFIPKPHIAPNTRRCPKLYCAPLETDRP